MRDQKAIEITRFLTNYLIVTYHNPPNTNLLSNSATYLLLSPSYPFSASLIISSLKYSAFPAYSNPNLTISTTLSGLTFPVFSGSTLCQT